MTTNSKEYQRARYEAHKEERKAYYKEYHKRRKAWVPNSQLFDMREDYKTPTREDFQSVETPVRSKAMEYYYANRERILEQQRENRARKKRNEKQRAYYAANREHICELQKKNRASKKRQEKLSKTFMGRLYLKIFG